MKTDLNADRLGIEFNSIPKELRSMAQEILMFIEKNNGKWSWYQLDRVLSHDENLPIMDRLLEAIKGLESNGLILSDLSDNESMPKYRITEAGINLLNKA
jgi:hypothetical protein